MPATRQPSHGTAVVPASFNTTAAGRRSAMAAVIILSPHGRKCTRKIKLKIEFENPANSDVLLFKQNDDAYDSWVRRWLVGMAATCLRHVARCPTRSGVL